MYEPVWQQRQPVFFGVCWWNYRPLRGLLAGTPYKPLFFRKFSAALRRARQARGCLVAWASRLTEEHETLCRQMDIPLVRIEDGFVRSVGLGAGMAPAASLVLDDMGIYYDARRPSRLEWLLQHMELDDAQRQRGARLRHLLMQKRISKYNIGKTFVGRKLAKGRAIILVPGQVADDASILCSKSATLDLGQGGNVNRQLLDAARRNNPDAFIIYKPHPDVSARLRQGYLHKAEILQYADCVVENADILDLIDQADGVETLTSLTGFEALLRGKSVVTHGLPFYAGWGLTQDRTAVPERRRRRRSLDELVYVTLVAYSHYVNPGSFVRCQPEEVISYLAENRHNRRLRLVNTMRTALAWVGARLHLEI